MVVRFRDRVESRGSKRSTAQESADRQPEPASRSMGFDGLQGVVRAGGGKAAGRGPPLEGLLVPKHHRRQPSLHGSIWLRSSATSRSITPKWEGNVCAETERVIPTR